MHDDKTPFPGGAEPFTVMDPDPVRRMELAIQDIAEGRMVILVDDEDRENEGDVTMAAARVTPEAINFMATHARGLICLSLTESRVGELGLPMMATNNRSPYGTAFTVSIEARNGVSTGISAHDRARTIQAAIDPATTMDDLVTPGHMFPLRARDAGVLARAGQTEGSVDLARIAGLHPSGVICEVMNEDGTMARLPDLERFGAQHRIRIVTIADIVRWRLRHERRVECVMEGTLPVAGLGEFHLRAFQTVAGGGIHLALSRGDLTGPEPVLVRLQSYCPAGDILGGLTCDCGAQLDAALQAIAARDRGVLVYLDVAGKDPLAVVDRLRRHVLPQEASGHEPQVSDEPRLRRFGVGAQILSELGVRDLHLLTNNPGKIVGLEGFGLKVAARIPIMVDASVSNRSFLRFRRDVLGHVLQGAG